MDRVPPAHPTRRVVLGVAVTVGTGGVLAACGGADTSGPQGSSSPPDGGRALTSAADVPVGGGVILTDERVVVTQPTAGTFKAFSSTCTHQSCQVTGISEGRITCPCHLSSFSIADGSPKGLAPSPLPEVAIKVEGDEVIRA
jgi:nitrite reductase/ring-hydroxylating ferredoxin subunit